MAFYDQVFYCNSVGYAAVTARPQNTAVAAGVIRRQFTAPAVNSERCFVCIIAGTTANVTDATWVNTRGAKTTDGTATWQECTGASAVNGDLTNTASWATAKATGVPTLGAIIKRNSGASYQICSTAGTMAASEPSFSDTAGVTTNDGTSVWTSLGPVGNFTGGQAPFARLAAACASTWLAVGGTVYVGDNHAESQGATLTFTTPGSTAGLITKLICHNHSGSYPPAASDITTGATVSTTTTFAMGITAGGSLYIYGIAFIAGVGGTGAVGSGSAILLQGSSSANGAWSYYDNCLFQIASTGSANWIVIGGTSNNTTMIWNNSTVSFAHAAQLIAACVTVFSWQNTGQILKTGSSVPNSLLGVTITGTATQALVLEALDLSQLTGNVFSSSAVTLSPGGSLLIKDCKLNASTAVATPLQTGMIVQLVRCDSGATAYKSARYQYEGTETTETSITRSGGAVDPSGQAQSRKIVTTANAQWLRPFTAEPYAIWNTVTGANVTVTVYGTINSASLPNNDDIWIEVEYLGSSATPLGTIVTTTKASLLASNAAVSSDASTWNGGGSGAGWSPFKLTTTLSSPQPGMAGYIDVRVRAAKASTTYYIDPKIELT